MICVPIKKRTIQTLLKDFEEAQKNGDIIEIAFDELKAKKEEIAKIFKLKKKPIIYKITTGENIEKTKGLQIDFFDIDEKNAKKEIIRVKKIHPHTKIIISSHDFKRTPSLKALQKKLTEIKRNSPDIIKIATFAKTHQDNLKIFEFLQKNSAKNKLVAIGMGEKGKITRVAGHLFGNYLMYAPLREKERTAPGQITVSKLKELKCLLK